MITSLTLTDFRSYAAATLPLDAGAVVLHGPNGAGKTNLLEALSLFTPGKGLRGATAQEMGRREPGETGGRAWAVALTLDGGDGEAIRLGTGVQVAGAGRRLVRIDGETAQPGRLLEYLRPVWATPEQDRLFSDARAERLKFFDRLVFAAEPGHAAVVSGYEKALRERLRLLVDGAEGREADPLWLDALEVRLAETGARAAGARARALGDRARNELPSARRRGLRIPEPRSSAVLLRARLSEQVAGVFRMCEFSGRQPTPGRSELYTSSDLVGRSGWTWSVRPASCRRRPVSC